MKALGRWPQTDEELWHFVKLVWGVEIPRQAVCEGHSAPFSAFADAFFARSDVAVWEASRGFGGKSFLLAHLGLTEQLALGADITILGGSGAQSGRVHAYMREGWELPVPKTARMPDGRLFLEDDPTKAETRLNNGGKARALPASQKQARGPHPQRLRLDEVDEMDLKIFDAAMGQTMSKGDVQSNTVISSTHQNPDGTMTEVKRRASTNGWPVYLWCYKETVEPHGWLPVSEVERKRNQVTKQMWETEYDLQEPSFEGRAFDPDLVELLFSWDAQPIKGSLDAPVGQLVLMEEPQPHAYRYATGADWARKQDWTEIVTWRTDCNPMRLVAYQRMQRMPWPVMIAEFNRRLEMFGGVASHDATGIGDVISPYIDHTAEDFIMSGRPRSELFSKYIIAVEHRELIAPRIEPLYGQHKYCAMDDLYGSGHPPDGVVACALGYRAQTGGFGGDVAVPVGAYKRSHWSGAG